MCGVITVIPVSLRCVSLHLLCAPLTHYIFLNFVSADDYHVSCMSIPSSPRCVVHTACICHRTDFCAHSMLTLCPDIVRSNCFQCQCFFFLVTAASDPAPSLLPLPLSQACRPQHSIQRCKSVTTTRRPRERLINTPSIPFHVCYIYYMFFPPFFAYI